MTKGNIVLYEVKAGTASQGCIVALRKSVTICLFGSLEKTWTLLEMKPVLPFALIFTVISPFPPGFIRLELAITAVHPQEGTNFSIMRSSVPVFVRSKVCSIESHLAIVPES
jgi:hypothetical protein